VRSGPSQRVARGPRARGFTLLEILVVMVIVAVLTTVGMISVGTLGADRGLDDEVERYSDVVAAAVEQAQLEGRDFGVHFAPDGYRVLAYAADRDRWEALADDRLYEFHRWPEGVRAALSLEGRIVPPEPPRDAAPLVPQVLLFSSGDVSPYVVTLVREGSDARFVVEGLPDGTLEVQRPGDSP
jgi:general secretion pathway protein H